MCVVTILLKTQEVNLIDLCNMGCAEAKKANGIDDKVIPIGAISQPHLNRAFVLVEIGDENSSEKKEKKSFEK